MDTAAPTPAQAANERNRLLHLTLDALKVFNVTNLVCNTKSGRFLLDINDSIISRHLMLYGHFEHDQVQQWLSFVDLKGGSGTMLDIGSNIGSTSIPLGLQKKFSRIFCFEPDPKNFQALEFNIKINDLVQSVVAVQTAIGSVDEPVTFELSNDNYGDHRISYGLQTGGMYNEQARKKITVPCSRLDTEIARNGIDINELVLIKCDSQGSEGHVFRGASSLLGRRQVPWVIEFWPYGLQRSGITPDEMNAIIRKYYSTFIEFGEGGQVQPVKPVDMFETLYAKYTGDTFCNVLLQP